MIDKLQTIAQAIQFLRLPAIAVGLFCLATMLLIILNNNSTGGDVFLIPSFVGTLWAMTTYIFIVTFRSVPEKADSNLGIFGKVKRRLHRSWYWVISIVFLGTTAAAIYFTYSVISIWARDYSV